MTQSKKSPTRMSRLFKDMLTQCPDVVQAYGNCVASIEDGVKIGACEKEFTKLKACFTRVAKK